jgi:UPF0755 protein
LVEGKVKLHSLTIVEGWTTRDLVRAMRKNPAIRQTYASSDGGALLATLQLSSPHPEGWFFPDTYRFPRGTTDREVLAMARDRMKVVLEQAWNGRSAALPLRSAYEALILASIVEKETSLDRATDDRRRVHTPPESRYAPAKTRPDRHLWIGRTIQR